MEYSTEEVNLIVADSFRELTYKFKKCFLAAQRQGGDGEKYADVVIKSCGAGVYNKLKEQFFDEAFRKKILKSLAENKVECITYKSADYPISLKSISVPPLVLYARGNRELLKERAFCIVGSRRSTKQALEECKKISAALCEHFVVYTGVADGADTAAALGAVNCGRAVCVLPQGHSRGGEVLRKVEKLGLSLSEFPPYTRSQPFMFTLRNRILAGLCEGVLVVSAGERGGALSTAGYAADYGKDVFAFPYNIGVASGVGCNKLIKNGAYLCDDINDIYSAMGIECVNADKDEEEELDEDEKLVLSALKENGELHSEKLALITGKKTFELNAICSSLEIKGLVTRTGGNKFAAL